MTARTVVAIASLSLAIGAPGCVGFYEIPIETPIQAKLDVTSFQRVLIVGFLAGGSKAVDPNTETARLLRSQLRTKSDLKVIDADVRSLVDEVDKRRASSADGSEPTAAAARQSAQNASDDPKIKDEKDLQKYESIFSDVDYWKKIGEEYQQPLIVTGSVLFVEISRSGMQSQVQEQIDDSGRRVTNEVRTYVDKKGYALVPKFIFIDGRTGQQLYSEGFREEVLYPTTQNTPPLSSYFELMDKLLPGFLNTLSTQKIKGTRILLK
jgi:hypothetical protein